MGVGVISGLVSADQGLVGGGVVAGKALSKHWAEVSADRSRQACEVSRVCSVQGIQFARHLGIKAAVTILANQMLGEALVASAAGGEDKRGDGFRPGQQASSVQALWMIGQLVDRSAA